MFRLQKTPLRRALFFVLSDIFLLALSVYLSYLLRFGGDIPGQYAAKVFPVALIFVTTKVLAFLFSHVYQMSWSYFGMYEMWGIVRALGLSSLILIGFSFVFRDTWLFEGMPRSLFFIDFFCSLFFVSGLRISKRFYLQIAGGASREGSKRTLIIGAGDAGEQIVRDMRRNPDSLYVPVAFIDDDPRKADVYIHGVRVYAGRKRIPQVVRRKDISVVLIAMPSAPSREVRDILGYIRESGVSEVKTIPGLNEILHGKVSLSDIKQIRIEDILGREQVMVDDSLIRERLKGRRILVTGAGGSIGSEVVRQALSYGPERLVALDIDETELFNLEGGLRGTPQGPTLCPVVGDVRDREKMRWVFANHMPHVVFHAAAYKHVPIMEQYPEEAVKTNILGTLHVGEMAVESGTELFVLVSTDKAVRPTNVMGATKRVAEKVVRELNTTESTRFVSVRFGNVVGSRGSVIPVFQEQIRMGGPVTVTHKEMTRYFMSIPEAVSLILQAGAMGEGGEVYVLDMGDPVRILDVAREMIRLHGLEPEVDIPIIFSGVRPGEKMYEELLTAKEDTSPTNHPKIFRARDASTPTTGVLQRLPLLPYLLASPDSSLLKAFLSEVVEGYEPDGSAVSSNGDSTRSTRPPTPGTVPPSSLTDD